MSTDFPTIAFVGAGNMNTAILKGAINDGVPANRIYVSNPSPQKLEKLASEYGVNVSQSNADVINAADIVILGVKPQKMAEACTEFVGKIININKKLFVSVAVGITIDRLHQLLGQEVGIVRVMPNTPSTLGAGVAGMFANAHTDEAQKSHINTLMQAVGITVWVDEEIKVDSIACVSGSGPAYFFRFMEAMVESAIKFGYDPQVARELVEHTAMGAALMVQQNQDTDIATLRRQVTSPGGTTAEAIRVFDENNIGQIVDDAMRAAFARAGEIAKNM